MASESGGWWSRFLAALGVGAVRLEVELGETEHPRGGLATGSVVAAGGSVPQEMREIAVSLVSFQGVGRGRESTTVLARQVLHPEMRIKPLERIVLPFWFQLPHDAPLPTTDFAGVVVSGCRIQAGAVIPWSLVQPGAKAPLNTVFDPAVESLLVGFRSLGFSETPWYLRHVSMPDDPAVTALAFNAPSPWSRWIDGVTLLVSATRTNVEGTLVVNAKERSLTERLKALVGGNRSERQFTVPRSRLIGANSLPDYDSAQAAVAELMDEAVSALTDDPRNRLLRPSAGPHDADRLLRPAGSAASRPDELLRPAEPDSPAQP